MSAQLASIWATTTIPGTHYWPDAHEGREYLASEHRHLFHVRVEVAVTNDERQIEFHDLAHDMRIVAESLADGEEGGMWTFKARSCETLARQLFDTLRTMGVPVIEVRWSEDAEFGATIRDETVPMPSADA